MYQEDEVTWVKLKTKPSSENQKRNIIGRTVKYGCNVTHSRGEGSLDLTPCGLVHPTACATWMYHKTTKQSDVMILKPGSKHEKIGVPSLSVPPTMLMIISHCQGEEPETLTTTCTSLSQSFHHVQPPRQVARCVMRTWTTLQSPRAEERRHSESQLLCYLVPQQLQQHRSMLPRWPTVIATKSGLQHSWRLLSI